MSLSNPLDGNGPLDGRGCRGVSGEIVGNATWFGRDVVDLDRAVWPSRILP